MNRRKRRGKHTNSRIEGQNRGRLGQIRDVEKNEGEGRTQGVKKMDTAAKSQARKTGNLERGEFGEGQRGWKRSWFWIGDDLRWW